jgi:hypothetical protein
MIAAEVSLAAIRRKRIASPMLRDENLDLTINELVRIRGRDAGSPAVVKALPAAKPAPARKASPRAAAGVSPRSAAAVPKRPAPVVAAKRRKVAKPRKVSTPRKAARRR